MIIPSSAEIRDPTTLEQRAKEPGFVLIRTGTSWRLFERPQEVIAISDPADFPHALRRIEDHVNAGGQAAGLLSYEAGYALEPLLHPLLSQRNGKLLWFGLYGIATEFQDIVFPASEPNDQIADCAVPMLQEQYFRKLDEIRELIAAYTSYRNDCPF